MPTASSLSPYDLLVKRVAQAMQLSEDFLSNLGEVRSDGTPVPAALSQRTPPEYKAQNEKVLTHLELLNTGLLLRPAGPHSAQHFECMIENAKVILKPLLGEEMAAVLVNQVVMLRIGNFAHRFAQAMRVGSGARSAELMPWLQRLESSGQQLGHYWGLDVPVDPLAPAGRRNLRSLAIKALLQGRLQRMERAGGTDGQLARQALRRLGTHKLYPQNWMSQIGADGIGPGGGDARETKGPDAVWSGLREAADRLYYVDPSVPNPQPRPQTAALTYEEAAALVAYTTQLYKNINFQRRIHACGASTGFTNWMAVAVRALNKLPVKRGRAFRHDGWGVHQHTRQQGTTFCDAGFLSAAQEFKGVCGALNAKVLVILDYHCGRDISFLSYYGTQEKEVLFAPGTRWRVTKRYDRIGNTFVPALNFKTLAYLAIDESAGSLDAVMYLEQMVGP
jgi:hypothetical protein